MGISLNRWAVRGTALLASALLQMLVIGLLLYALQAGFTTRSRQRPQLPDQFRGASVALVDIPLRVNTNSVPRERPVGRSTPTARRIRQIDAPVPEPVLTEDEEASDAQSPAPAIPGAMDVQCEVHIHQSARGQVQAIDFGECTGDAIWQRTLLAALEQAAKLVSPSDGVVFPPVRTLTLRTASISPQLLARQLSLAELPKDDDAAVLEESGAHR